ncbi:NAD-dependent epimerase/dehydratase family protein [Kamptonema formosum]|uniref:NAD-dependent epimerase/dehydratase family protein n=1 Tax=Kamptonema formosum TaxID=331992 RepID=UPI000346BAA5|nr:NAD-dependent epimerase/dehydratase family protein [Oscillatoria sp. PCC 10802]
MKVLVTGATGFVGSHLTETLVKDGCDVRIMARQSSDTSLLEKLDVEIVRGDITDAGAVERAVTGCQQVYHLAAQMLKPGTSIKLYFTVNIEGTKNLVRAALKANVERLVYTSSAGVYGILKNPPVTENSPPNPSSAYRESKWLGEEVVRSGYQKEGLPVAIVRLPGVFGPGSLSLLGLTKIIATKRFRMIGTGENHDHLGYVSDVVDGLRRCAQTKGIEGECYLIAGKEPVKVKELVEMIARELGIENSFGSLPVAPYRAFNALGETVYKRFGFELPRVHRYALFLADKILDLSKAEKELGYCPKVSVREGIKQTVQWYRQKGYV